MNRINDGQDHEMVLCVGAPFESIHVEGEGAKRKTRLVEPSQIVEWQN